MTDDEQFTELFRSLYPYLLAFARRRVGPHEAQDIAEEVLLVAWRRLDELPDEPLPWLYRAASFEISYRRRRIAKDARLREALGRVRYRTTAPDPADEVACAADLAVAFTSLSERDQEVLRLAAWERLSPSDGAFVLGCSVAAYKVRLHRARRRLARLLISGPARVSSTDADTGTRPGSGSSSFPSAPRFVAEEVRS
jgi:RNA polymerase sigma-70 factor, ECF subfamily